MPLNQLAFLCDRLALRIYKNGPAIRCQFTTPIPLGARPESEFLHLLDFHFLNAAWLELILLSALSLGNVPSHFACNSQNGLRIRSSVSPATLTRRIWYLFFRFFRCL